MMPERLSDERLRELTTSRPLTAEARAMAAEIFALRALCAAGPVMPKTPSAAVRAHLRTKGWRSGVNEFWRDTRAALEKEQWS